MTRKYYDNDCEIIIAALNRIREEMDRLYWNKYQKEMESPFDNTGEAFVCSTFMVRAYDWNWDDDDSKSLPNFKYEDLSVYWYKHSQRGVWAECDHEITTSFLNTMILECGNAYKNYLKKGET